MIFRRRKLVGRRKLLWRPIFTPWKQITAWLGQFTFRKLVLREVWNLRMWRHVLELVSQGEIGPRQGDTAERTQGLESDRTGFPFKVLCLISGWIWENHVRPLSLSFLMNEWGLMVPGFKMLVSMSKHSVHTLRYYVSTRLTQYIHNSMIN